MAGIYPGNCNNIGHLLAKKRRASSFPRPGNTITSWGGCCGAMLWTARRKCSRHKANNAVCSPFFMAPAWPFLGGTSSLGTWSWSRPSFQAGVDVFFFFFFLGSCTAEVAVGAFFFVLFFPPLFFAFFAFFAVSSSPSTSAVELLSSSVGVHTRVFRFFTRRRPGSVFEDELLLQ